jgi:hypothetical protein
MLQIYLKALYQFIGFIFSIGRLSVNVELERIRYPVICLVGQRNST